jgi:three-Cys-motif partner protein
MSLSDHFEHLQPSVALMAKPTKKFFKEYKDHTRLKLSVLREYLARWARILMQRGIQRRVWFVDGFAGKGQDEKGNEGSPLIACRMAREIEAEFGAGNREVRVIAVEANRTNALDLRRTLEAFTPAQGRLVPVYDGELADHLAEILGLTRDEPTLFFLDPFGVKGLRADLVPQLLSGRMNELLILFSPESAHRLRGAATAPKPRSKKASHKEQGDMFSIEPEAETVDERVSDESDDDSDPAVRAWETTAPASEEILDVAFGGNSWKPIMEATPRHSARRKWLDLYMEVLRRNGARYVTPLSVVDHDDDHIYYLVHAAKDPKAVQAMKDAVRTAMNAREREAGRQQGMLFSTMTDIDGVVRQLARRFGGTGPVRWTDKKEYEKTVQGFAICETHALYADMDALQEALAAHGYLVSKKRPIAYEFPAFASGA